MAKTVDDFVQEALRTVREVTVEEASRLDGWVLLDVREPDEFAAGRPPRALNVPRGFLEVKADLEHPKRDARLADRSQKIACFCGGGVRSAMAAKTLQEMGFADVVSVRGGWTAWAEAGLPVEKD
jgi:rhodanese-related sulfurtransferase